MLGAARWCVNAGWLAGSEERKHRSSAGGRLVGGTRQEPENGRVARIGGCPGAAVAIDSQHESVEWSTGYVVDRVVTEGMVMGYQAEFKALLESIAEEADAIALKYFRTGDLRVDRKGDGSPVTQADRSVEEMARARVAASGLPLDILGEEMGGADPGAASRSGRARLIIDPIDGTEEFSRGIPIFGTLLGIERDGEIVAGMASAPALRTRWSAYRGEGAYRNGQRIHVSLAAKMSESMVFTTGAGPSKDAGARTRLRKLLDAARNGRSLGGFWQHMLVAEGSVEAAVDWTSKPWDLAALGIIVEEAGGRATNLAGVRTIYTGDFVSSNGKLHEEVLELLR